MIRRYSREAMRNIWAEENKFSIWLQIEILACEARKIPAKDLTANHDVVAFTTNVAEHVGLFTPKIAVVTFPPSLRISPSPPTRSGFSRKGSDEIL